MKKNLVAICVLLLLAFTSACCCTETCAAEKKTEQEKRHPLFESWEIETLPSAAAKKIKPAPNAGIVFQREKNTVKVYGCAGDNRFFGNVKVDGRKLSFSHMGMTRMMGPNAAYEGLFMEALNQVTQFAVINGEMHLQNKNGKTVMILKVKTNKPTQRNR